MMILVKKVYNPGDQNRKHKNLRFLKPKLHMYDRQKKFLDHLKIWSESYLYFIMKNIKNGFVVIFKLKNDVT